MATIQLKRQLKFAHPKSEAIQYIKTRLTLAAGEPLICTYKESNGKWGAIEIKLGGEKLINDGVASLNRLKNKIKTKSNEQEPSFMMVLTATGPLYRRDDGIYIVPINCLKD